MHMKNALKVLEKCFHTRMKQQSDSYTELQEKGLFLTSHGKGATILVLEDSEKLGHNSDHWPIDSERNEAVNCLLVEALFSDNERLVKPELRTSVPLIVVCQAQTTDALQELFSKHDHFSFDSDKVCNSRFRNSNREALLGLVNSRKANVGLEVYKDLDQSEENLHMVFSINFMKKIANQTNKLHFEAIPKANICTEKVGKEWIEVVPSSPNSLEFHCSIYSCLNSCPSSEICVLEVTE